MGQDEMPFIACIRGIDGTPAVSFRSRRPITPADHARGEKSSVLRRVASMLSFRHSRDRSAM